MPFEGVETFGPHLSVRLQPCVDIAEWLRGKGVDPARTVHLNGDDTCLAQHSEVLGNSRLRHFQRVDQAADVPPATLKCVVGHCHTEIVQNAAARVLSHNGEAVHDL